MLLFRCLNNLWRKSSHLLPLSHFKLPFFSLYLKLLLLLPLFFLVYHLLHFLKRTCNPLSFLNPTNYHLIYYLLLNNNILSFNLFSPLKQALSRCDKCDQLGVVVDLLVCFFHLDAYLALLLQFKFLIV
jgi:hypothetical protein